MGQSSHHLAESLVAKSLIVILSGLTPQSEILWSSCLYWCFSPDKRTLTIRSKTIHEVKMANFGFKGRPSCVLNVLIEIFFRRSGAYSRVKDKFHFYLVFLKYTILIDLSTCNKQNLTLIIYFKG